MLLSSVISISIFFQNVSNFSPNRALVFLSTTAGSSVWRGRDRQVAKDKKGGNLFPFFLCLHQLRIKETTDRKKPGTLSNACSSAHAYHNRPQLLQGSPEESTSPCLTCSYFIHYQAERRRNFHFSPAQVHIEWIRVIPHRVLCNSNIIHSSLSSSLLYSGTKLVWAQGAPSADKALPTGKCFTVPVNETLRFFQV